MKNKIAFVTIYFGDMPKFMNLFLDSAKNNPDFDFYFFSDWCSLPIEADNINHQRLTFKVFNELAFRKKIIKNKINNAYKLCDLKPAWLDILSGLINFEQYEYLGYLDIDLILGNLNKFISLDKIKPYDIWTISPDFISGVLTLFKNRPELITLYKKSPSWEIIFNSPQHFAFDEKLRILSCDSLDDSIKLESFSDLIKKEEESGLKVYHSALISYNRDNEKITYKDRQLRDKYGKEEILYHFVYVKYLWFWYFPNWKTLPNYFKLNKYGLNRYFFPLNIFTSFLHPPFCFHILKKIYLKRKNIITHMKNLNFKYIFTIFKNSF